MFNDMFKICCKTSLLVCMAYIVTSCSDGTPSLGPENGVVFSENIGVGSEDNVLRLGVVTAIQGLPNAQESVITASFIGLPENSGDLDEVDDSDDFVEFCSVEDRQIDPILTLAGTVEVNVGGNVEVGDELMVNDDSGLIFMTLDKVIDDEQIGYVGRISSGEIFPEELTVEIPGTGFSRGESVRIPLVDPIQAFSPEPGSSVDRNTAFTWEMMEPVGGQSDSTIEISIVTDDHAINCTTFDDGAFVFTDASGVFDIDEFEGSVLSTVARQTRTDSFSGSSRVTGVNLAFIGVERAEDDLESEIAAGEFGDLLEAKTEYQLRLCQLPSEDRIDDLLTDTYCQQLMCEKPLEDRSDPTLTDEMCEELGPIPRPPSPVLGDADFQCLDESFVFSGTTLSMLSRERVGGDFVVRQSLRPSSIGSARGFGQRRVDAARSYTLTQDIQFEQGFDLGGTSVGGKVGFGFYGGTSPTGGSISPDGWSARLMWRENNNGTGRFVVYSYAFDRVPVGGSFGEDYRLAQHEIPFGQYVNVAMTVTANTPGNSDGSVQVWVDGVQLLDRGGIMWQRNGVPGVDKVGYSTFYGGNSAAWAPERVGHLRFRDVCWGSAEDVRG